MDPDIASQVNVTCHSKEGTEAITLPKMEECAAIDEIQVGDDGHNVDDDIVFLHINAKKQKAGNDSNLKVNLRRPSRSLGSDVGGTRTTRSGRAIKNTVPYFSSTKRDQQVRQRKRERPVKKSQAPARSVEAPRVSHLDAETLLTANESPDVTNQPREAQEVDGGDIVVRVRGVHRSFQQATMKEIKGVVSELRHGHNELLRQAKVVELSYKRLEAMLTLARTK